jgi:hypothetical protein
VQRSISWTGVQLCDAADPEEGRQAAAGAAEAFGTHNCGARWVVVVALRYKVDSKERRPADGGDMEA